MTLIRVAAGLAVAFVALTVVVAAGWDVPGDGWLLRKAKTVDALDAAARVVDRATGYTGIGVLAALLVAAQVVRGRVRDGVTVALSVGGAVTGNALLKRLVDRQRPGLAEAPVSELSYPSGHAAATAALALAVLLAVRGSRRAAAAGALLVVATAAAQLLLGLHHPSDLVGGWLWAAAWVLVAIRLSRDSRSGAARSPAARSARSPRGPTPPSR